MSQLTTTLSKYWNRIQGTLFPWLEKELDPLTEKQQQLIAILEVVRIEEFLPRCDGYEGRPRKNRAHIARSFIAKTVYNIDTTTLLSVSKRTKAQEQRRTSQEIRKTARTRAYPYSKTKKNDVGGDVEGSSNSVR